MRVIALRTLREFWTAETMEINPISNEREYELTLGEIDKLFEAKRNTPEGDRLEVLVSLVETYEQEHHPMPLPDPIDALLYHLESRYMTESALEPYIGSAARVAEVLDRKRPLTIGMIRRLHQGLGISADVLIQPSRRSDTRGRSRTSV